MSDGRKRDWRTMRERAGEDPARTALERATLIDRRMAMRMMGASAALAAAAACSEEKGTIAGGRTAGRSSRDTVPLRTTLEMNGLGFGVVVDMVDGNPVKIEGDPDHPASRGRSNVWAQAALLQHYDPQRLQRAMVDGREVSWPQQDRWLRGFAQEVRRNGGAGLHLLVQPVASPTHERLLTQLADTLPEARIYRYRPLPIAPGPVPDFSARHIVAVEQDFLGPGPMQVAVAAAWAEARAEAGGPKLTVIESVPTLTGAQAERRISASPREMDAALARVMKDHPDAVVLDGRGTSPSAIKHRADLAAFARAVRRGDGCFVILAGNPALAGRFSPHLAQVDALYCGVEANETARACRTLVPTPGQLAQWGDLAAFDGSVSLVRPVARGTGISEIELLALLAGEEPDGEALVRATSRSSYEFPEQARAEQSSPPGGTPGGSGAFTLRFSPSAGIWDGELFANGWAQELPDPITGIAWGNAATLSPRDADRLEIEDGEEVEISLGDRSLVAPALILPGQADGVVGLTLGYGRELVRNGGRIGYDAYALYDGRSTVAGARLTRTGGTQRLIQPGEYLSPSREDAVRHFAPGDPPLRSDRPQASFAHPERSAQKQWGMAIDLDACIGCNACTIACQAENNVPVVGPEETAAGRVMHWLRVDRYHRGAPENPETAFQPVPCMHCETAPCEPVCPTAATSHSSEGLNQMTYQRCIGTRSCSNNCPYKVRRFNWFEYASEPGTRPEEATNPRVHVRERGVMEKCTYCVQRIEAARHPGRDGDKPTPVTACQQACPTNAIVFGDLADPESEVARLRAQPRNYDLLGNLNLFPRTTYLARYRRDEDD